jgi:hypothetical protein
MLAHAVLTVIAARERIRPDQTAATTITHWLAWSRWRRLHQARARASHYRRRDQQPIRSQ